MGIHNLSCVNDSAVAMLNCYARPGTFPNQWWLGPSRTLLIFSDGEWQIDIGEGSYVVNEDACCRVIFAIMCDADLSTVKEALGIHVSREQGTLDVRSGDRF